MKKWIPALLAVLLVWNILLTYGLLNKKDNTRPAPASEEVTENTITDFTTDLTEVIDRVRPGVVTVTAVLPETRITSSGVIWSKEGNDVYVVTSDNVILKDAEIRITFDSGTSIPAQIVGKDSVTGIGLLKVVPDFEVTPLRQSDSGLLEQGEYVFTIGGRRPSTGAAMVAFGVVSEPGRRRVTISNLWAASVIETDSAVTSENVGGAMLDLGGRLVGILIQKPADGQEKMGYALAVNETKIICAELMEKGTADRGSLGITARNVSELLPYERNARSIPLDLMTGVIVTASSPDYNAEVNLQEGDVITDMNGTAVTDVQDLLNRLYLSAPEETVVLKVLRNGETIEMSVVLR